jgi:hypothetical protein
MPFVRRRRVHRGERRRSGREVEEGKQRKMSDLRDLFKPKDRPERKRPAIDRFRAIAPMLVIGIAGIALIVVAAHNERGPRRPLASLGQLR